MQLAVRARHWGSLHDVRTLKLKQLNGLQSFVVVLFTCASPDETCQHVLGSLNTETTPLLFLHTCKNKFYLLWRMNPTHTGYQIMTFIFCHNGLFSCSSIIISRTSLGLRISQTSRTSWRRQLGALGRYQRHMRPLSDVQIFDQSFKKRSHLVDRIFLFLINACWAPDVPRGSSLALADI